MLSCTDFPRRPALSYTNYLSYHAMLDLMLSLLYLYVSEISREVLTPENVGNHPPSGGDFLEDQNIYCKKSDKKSKLKSTK